MKRLEKFLTDKPGYTKWGNARLAEKLKLSERTVKRFKATEAYKTIKDNYIVSC